MIWSAGFTHGLAQELMPHVTCMASIELTQDPRYDGLCTALSDALSPIADGPFTFRLTSVSQTHVALDLLDPAGADGAPMPLLFVLTDMALTPDHHAQFATSIVQSLRQQGLLTAD
jgi:hypothetical protein